MNNPKADGMAMLAMQTKLLQGLDLLAKAFNASQREKQELVQIVLDLRSRVEVLEAQAKEKTA
jgi:hypothetical protein